jgi:hypothetical protein
MAVIVLSIYKTCTKYHETRRHTYLHVHRSDLHDFNSYDYTQYPAPPPPYENDNNNNNTITDNNDIQRSSSSDNLLITSNGTNTISETLRSGYETPPPEYEEDSKILSTRR